MTELALTVSPVIVETAAEWDAMVERISEEPVLAIDTETVGFETLELYEQAEEKRIALKEVALAHCAAFPRAIGVHPKMEFDERGKIIPNGNEVRGAKKSLERVLKVHKEIGRLQKQAQGSLSGLRFWDSHIGCFQIGLPDGTCYMIRPQNFSREQWLELGKIINNRKTLLLQNAQFDIKVIYTHCGFLLDGRKIFDTKLAQWLLYNGLNKSKSLKSLVKEYLGLEMDKDVSVRVSNWLGPWNDKQLKYAAKDVVYLFPVWEKQAAKLREWGLRRAHRMRCEFTTVAAILDMSGLPLDLHGLEGFRERTEKKLKYIEADLRMQAQADDDFNPNSPTQVYDVLSKFGIEVDDTNEKTLMESIYSDHPVVRSIIDYRECAKLLSSITKYLEWNVKGRMMSQFHIDGTHTGRLSSGNTKGWGKKDPYYTNAQNPTKGEFREYIRAPKGRKFVNADYSQIEIRWMAHFSGDPVMMEAYRNNEDLHKLTATIIAGLSMKEFEALSEEKQKEYRQKAKAVNFGLLFGGGWKMLINYAKANYDVILTEQEAQKIRSAWKKKYAKVGAWGYGFQDWHPKQVREAGLVRTASGLIRFFWEPGKRPPEKDVDEKCRYTDCLNTPIQGSAADGLINAMNKLVYGLLDDGYEAFVDFWLPTVVHDEVLLECLEQYAEDFAERVVSCMREGMLEFIKTIPVEVEPKIVDNWKEAK